MVTSQWGVLDDSGSARVTFEMSLQGRGEVLVLVDGQRGRKHNAESDAYIMGMLNNAVIAFLASVAVSSDGLN